MDIHPPFSKKRAQTLIADKDWPILPNFHPLRGLRVNGVRNAVYLAGALDENRVTKRVNGMAGILV